MRFLSTSNSLSWNTIEKKTTIECVGSSAERRKKKKKRVPEEGGFVYTKD